VREWFRARSLAVASIECLTAWPGGAVASTRAEAEAACMVADLLGAPQIVAVCVEGQASFGELRDGLRLAADVAASFGCSVAVEWVPATAVPSLAATKSLVEAVGRPNVGYVVDALHWQCAPEGPEWAVLGSLPGDRLLQLQLSDCALPLADGVVEPSRRLLPGDGNIDLLRLASTVLEANPEAVIAAEVFDAERLVSEGVAAVAGAQAAATRRLLASLAARGF
jgi:sugar phosphate isomerase/epimerase